MIRLARPSIGPEEIAAVTSVLESGMLVQGEIVARFEREIAALVGCEHAVMTSSGTAALHVALLALGIGRGDAVFVPAFTFPATANVVELVGARPVFVDVDPRTYCMTAASLERAIDAWDGVERARAVMPVHEFGAPCGRDVFESSHARDLLVVEDAACAFGTRVGARHAGTLGNVGCFSWHPRKAITSAEGGCLVTDDAELARLARLLRSHGLERSASGAFDLSLPGFNYRMTEIHAALGLVQLGRHERWLAVRRELALRYRANLASSPHLELPADVEGHAWQTFMVVLPSAVDRDRVIGLLLEEGVETNLGAHALHCLAFYRDRYGLDRGAHPVATRLFERGLALPAHPGLEPSDVDLVCDLLGDVLSA